MRRVGSIICLLLVLAVGACTPPSGTGRIAASHEASSPNNQCGEISSIKFEEFFLLHQGGKLLLIDARDPWFYRQGRIPAAINIAPDGDINAQLEALKPQLKEARSQDHPIVVYCNGFGCHDARTVLKAISKLGFDCTKFGGGWKAWKNVGLPIESSSNQEPNLTPQAAS